MAVFQSKRYRPASPHSAYQQTLAARYRRLLPKHPFLLFGLPFLSTIVAASFFLTPATALRYEKHDRKVQRMSEDEALGLGKNSRRVGGEGGRDTMREEYYRLAAKDLDDWENKRVERLKGEPDGIL
ncbi:MAG: hypothetical protein LQ340_002104 [Diploschistes diacapsis]|nr:MAG: hypothetical protein LQ340_002104 [Diploschistes diacapsis]